MDYFQTSQNPNVRRMLDAIASAEGTDKYGYNTMFGGTKFDDLSAHPNQLIPFTQTDGKENLSSAAGRYQFINPTWSEVSKKLDLKDFGPESQDAAAVYLIERAGALEDLMSGDFKAATDKLGGTWASLPSSDYPQPKKTEEEFMAMVNQGQREPGFVESMVNAVVPAAQAATSADQLAEMVLPEEARKIAQENLEANESQKQKVDDLSAVTAADLVYEIPEYQDQALVNEYAQTGNALPQSIEDFFGGGVAGPVRTQNLNQTHPELAKAFSTMRGKMGSVLPLALGASMSNDVGARRMGESMLPMALESMIPIDIGAGQVLPDGTYVTDKAVSNNSVKDLRVPPSTMQRNFTEEAGMADYMGRALAAFDDDYAGYVFDKVGDISNWVGNRLPGYDSSQANWWSQYQVFVNKVRNKEFGSALTEPERREFLKASATPGLKPSEVRARVQNQIRIITNSMRAQTNVARDSGYQVNGFENEMERMAERTPDLAPYLFPQRKTTEQSNSQEKKKPRTQADFDAQYEVK